MVGSSCVAQPVLLISYISLPILQPEIPHYMAEKNSETTARNGEVQVDLITSHGATDGQKNQPSRDQRGGALEAQVTNIS